MPVKPLLGLALTSFLLLGLSGCRYPKQTVKPASKAQTLTFNLESEPPQLDPIRMSDLTSFNVANQLMRGLTFGPGTTVVPAVAERWDLSPDAKTYTFYLRPTAKWSDGQPVTAQQFLDNWQRALTASNGSGYAFFLFGIANAEAFYKGTIKEFKAVGVKALTPHTLQITLNKPLPYFLTLLASPVFLPIRLDVIKKYGSTFTEAGHFVGNGPYLLNQWQHYNQLLLTPNPNYWQPNTRLKQLRFLMIQEPNTALALYQNNTLDVLDRIAPSDYRWLKKHKEAHLSPSMGLFYMGFNTKLPPFNTIKVRQAFALATDRRYFTDLLASGQTPITQFLPPALALPATVAKNSTLPFNPQQAKALLAQAGYPNGKGFPQVEFVFANRDSARKEAEMLQFMLKETLNVTLRLKAMDWKVFLSTLANHPPALYRLSWYADYPDADSFLALFHTSSGNNYTGWHSKPYDALIETAASSNNPSQRQAFYQQAQHLLLNQQAVVVPWYSPSKLWLIKPTVCGVQFNAMSLWLLDEAHRCKR
jgi:oligopeptide transport system substrate-binding protein